MKMHHLVAVDWVREPSRNHGRRPKASPPMPEPGFISAKCGRNKCCECYALKCSHECHKRGG